MAPTIRITTRGAFSVRAEDGADLTPRGKKTRGVLALLALSPGHRRERAWIVGRLWSDRGPEQGLGSLRQALSEIRCEGSPIRDVLHGYGKPWVALNAEAVAVDGSGAGELLEGMGIRDPAFRRWLSGVRSAVPALAPPAPAGAAPSAPDPRRITVHCVSGRGGSSAALLGDFVAHQIGEGIEGQIHARRLSEALDGAPIDLEVRCDVIENDGVSMAWVRITHPPTGEVLHARQCRMDAPAAVLLASDAMARVSYEAAEVAVGKLPQMLGLERPVSRANAFGRLALLRMFSYDPPAVAEADGLLARASEADANGIYDAWQSFLQMVKWVDLGAADSRESREAAQAHMGRAAQLAGDDPVAQALVAYTKVMLLGDAEGAAPAAARAAEMSPSSPVALISLASARMLAGHREEAYALSRRARGFAEGSRFRHWWDGHHCVVCMATGRLEEAVEAAEAAARVAHHKAAHRHLLALYAARGDLEGAERMRLALERIEPGFTLDRMLSDPDYPVRTLRRTGLLEAARRIL